jgi:Family of unknown function (DUF6507)
MSSYRIEPAGVETVLKQTQTDAEKFGTILKPLEGWVESAATATGSSGAVVPALSSFFENQSVVLQAINTRVGAALSGAFNATKAYCDGDIEMVDVYQQKAAEAANPLPPPTGHGRMVPN